MLGGAACVGFGAWVVVLALAAPRDDGPPPGTGRHGSAAVPVRLACAPACQEWRETDGALPAPGSGNAGRGGPAEARDARVYRATIEPEAAAPIGVAPRAPNPDEASLALAALRQAQDREEIARRARDLDALGAHRDPTLRRSLVACALDPGLSVGARAAALDLVRDGVPLDALDAARLETLAQERGLDPEVRDAASEALRALAAGSRDGPEDD